MCVRFRQREAFTGAIAIWRWGEREDKPKHGIRRPGGGNVQSLLDGTELRIARRSLSQTSRRISQRH